MDDGVDPSLDARTGGDRGEGGPGARYHRGGVQEGVPTNYLNRGGVEAARPDQAETGESPVHH